MSDQNRYRKIAREAYERALVKGGGRCSIEDVHDELLEELVAQGMSDDIVEEFANSLVKGEDDRRRSEGRSGQLDLLTGDDAALDVVWRLGKSERVQARHAVRSDWIKRLGLMAENLARVSDSFSHEQDLYSRLSPFMTDDTITVEEARARYRAT